MIAFFMCFHSPVAVPVGCFWCVEAVYQRVVGVSSVESGYMGGIVSNPSYGQVREHRPKTSEDMPFCTDILCSRLLERQRRVIRATTDRLPRFIKRLKNVSCECDRLNG